MKILISSILIIFLFYIVLSFSGHLYAPISFQNIFYSQNFKNVNQTNSILKACSIAFKQQKIYYTEGEEEFLQKDLWGTPIKAGGNTKSSFVKSAGPDKTFNTPDDIVCNY